MSLTGYEVNMRRDRRSGEDLAVIPKTYNGSQGRYYLAFTRADGWVELTPKYVTRSTRSIKDYPTDLKRAIDRNMGYILNTVGRVFG